MTALLDEPRAPPAAQTPAQNLRAGMAAVRVRFTWMGTRKTLSADQRAEAAQPFDAEGESLSAGKKILDTATRRSRRSRRSGARSPRPGRR